LGFFGQDGRCGASTKMFDHDDNATTAKIAGNASMCRKFSDIFANGMQACKDLWRSSGADAFVPMPAGTPPNAVFLMAGAHIFLG
jgi:hypothetical protein